ncbi:MAG: hypothetical protein EOM93_06340 [Gammaproteobacteria bacterium]|nr:hypothetical protein [Gammaproteobacteria bacterium]
MYHAAALLPTVIGLSQNLLPWTIAIRSDEAGTAEAPWEITIKSASDSRITSSEGALLPGSYMESLPNGETKAALVLRASVPAGKTVSISTVDELTLFTGSVVRSSYDAESDTWTVTAADPLSAQGMDEEFEIVRAGDVADVIPFEFLDLSEGTAFPTVPVSDGITLRYWVQLLEALRGARLYYDPTVSGYVLSGNPRVWNLSKVLTFSEEVDASQYFNTIVAEQNDSWEETATRATSTKEYGGYTLIVDRAGDKIYSVKLVRGIIVGIDFPGGSGTLVDETFEYDADNQLTRQVSKKDAKTTTTEYLIQPGDIPYIKREMSVTVDSNSETEFDERTIKSVDVAANEDESLVVRILETREWWEGETEATTPEEPEDPFDPPTPEPLTLRISTLSYVLTASYVSAVFYLVGGASSDGFTDRSFSTSSGLSVSWSSSSSRSVTLKIARGTAGAGTHQVSATLTAGENTWDRTISVVVT